jgi:hypothetical protein
LLQLQEFRIKEARVKRYAEQDLLHRDVALEEDTGGIQQHQAGQQAQEEMPLVGVFRQHLTGLCGHQVFQPPEIMFDPTLPLP